MQIALAFVVQKRVVHRYIRLSGSVFILPLLCIGTCCVRNGSLEPLVLICMSLANPNACMFGYLPPELLHALTIDAPLGLVFSHWSVFLLTTTGPCACLLRLPCSSVPLLSYIDQAQCALLCSLALILYLDVFSAAMIVVLVVIPFQGSTSSRLLPGS
jgi:hypothetical protein